MVKRENGFAVVIGVVLVAIIAAGIAAWFIWSRNEDKAQNSSENPTPTSQVEEQEDTNQEKDQTEDDEYLVIKEWGVKTKLPPEFQKKTTYELGEIIEDPTGNNIQAAKINVLSSAFPGSMCASTKSPIGQIMTSAAQYIRSESAKPFDETRYRFNFEKEILVLEPFSFHLDYAGLPCLGNEENIELMSHLYKSLAILEKS